MWSNDDPDAAFLEILRGVFGNAQGHVVSFDNPLTQAKSSNGVYVALVPREEPSA
jgi:hypothetical protein